MASNNQRKVTRRGFVVIAAVGAAGCSSGGSTAPREVDRQIDPLSPNPTKPGQTRVIVRVRNEGESGRILVRVEALSPTGEVKDVAKKRPEFDSGEQKDITLHVAHTPDPDNIRIQIEPA